MDSEELKDRTKKFALNIIRLVEKFPKTRTGVIIGCQLVRAGTSVGANYRSACIAQSRAHFISKMNIVLEEADESIYWLELTVESALASNDEVKMLHKEAKELTAIFTTSIKTARRNKF